MKRHAILLAVLAMSLTAFEGTAFAQGDGDLAAQAEAGRQLRNYMVEDWRGHRLSAPPKGYHWVQVGGDYVLVANNTGVIRQFYPVR